MKSSLLATLLILVTTLSAHPGVSAPQQLTTAQVFARKIFDLTSHPKNSAIKLASAQGLYYKSATEEKWQRLEQFGDDNKPVAISHSGTLYVGTQRSRDGGKTFEDYIPWDQVLSQVVAVTHRTHEHVKITRIRIDHPQEVHLLIDAGSDELVDVSLKD